MFRKSDLKDDDIVTYRNGDKRIVRRNELTNKSGIHMNSLSNYTEDLNDDCRDIALDIVKVERATEYETVFERKEEILDEAEKRYLRDVIRPFRNKVTAISKEKYNYKEEYIQIDLGGTAGYLPNFKANTMYKKMEVDKRYTLEELGL